MRTDAQTSASPPSAPASSSNACATQPVLAVEHLTIRAGGRVILRDVSLTIPARQVFGLVGPSGAGKSTLLRALNRLVDLQPGFRVEGSIRFDGEDIRAPDVDPDELRRRIGTVFQQPAVFPVSITANVLFGARHHRKLRRVDEAGLVESSLRSAGLWDEVKDRLKESALRLSVGQQQRLCIARTLAVDPEVILMDEPTSALDVRSTELIESLILQLRGTRTIVIVTHDLEQARRVTDWVACLCPKDGAGQILESACCDAFFSNPACLANLL